MHQGSAYTYFVEVTLVLALSILSFTVEEYNTTYNAKQFLWKLSNSHKKNNYWLFISHWTVVNKPLTAFISFCQFLLPLIPFNTRFSILLNWKVQEETTCQGMKLIFFSDSHLAPKFFKVVANSKKVGRHFQRQTKPFFTLSAFQRDPPKLS